MKLDYSSLNDPPEYIRDVSNVGHWGVGDVEINVDDMEKLKFAKDYVKKSFEINR